jgi:hypothetical protein
MTSLVRYFAADVLRAQRWAAPMLVYLAALMITSPTIGPVLPTYAMSAAALLPVAMWVTVVVFHSEEPVQAAITMVVVGAFTRVWLGKVLTALLGALLLGLAALFWISVATPDTVTVPRLGVGAVDYVMNALAGVAFGTLISRPVTPKVAWTVLLGVAVCMAQLLIKHVPPMNAMLQLYSGDGPDAIGALLLIAAETVVLSGLLIGAAHVVARSRS